MDIDLNVSSIFAGAPSVHEEQSPGLADGFGVGGTFFVECYDKDGNLKWKDEAKNIIPTTNLNNILDVYYGASAQTTTWYMGMVDNAGFSAFNSTDLMNSHAGWTENTNTSLSARPTWTPSASSAGSTSNASAVTIPMNPSSTCTIKGFFLTSSNTLGGTAGLLSAEAALTTPQVCSNGDTLKVTYAINATTS